MQEYALGFAFDAKAENVVLIKKNKPDWQKGLLNGVGGKRERGELPSDCMSREFEEETGLSMPAEDWQLFAIMNGSDWKVYCYRTFSNSVLAAGTNESESGEEVAVINIKDYEVDMPVWKEMIVPNLSYLIPMAMDRSLNLLKPTEIYYR